MEMLKATTTQTTLLHDEWMCLSCVGNLLNDMNDAYSACALYALRSTSDNSHYKLRSTGQKSCNLYNTSRANVHKELTQGLKDAEALEPQNKLKFEKLKASFTAAIAALDAMYDACADTPPSCVATDKFRSKVDALLGLKDELTKLQPAIQRSELKERAEAGKRSQGDVQSLFDLDQEQDKLYIAWPCRATDARNL